MCTWVSYSYSTIIQEPKHHPCYLFLVPFPVSTPSSPHLRCSSSSFLASSLRRFTPRPTRTPKITLINPPNPLHLLPLTSCLEKPRVIRPINSKDCLLIPFPCPAPLSPAAWWCPIRTSLQKSCDFRPGIDSRVPQTNNANLLPVRHRMHIQIRPSQLHEPPHPSC